MPIDDLELQVLRLNVSGIMGDVHEVTARAASVQRCRNLLHADRAEPHARYDRLQEHMRLIEERLAALELRCYCRSVAATGHPRHPESKSPCEAERIASI